MGQRLGRRPAGRLPKPSRVPGSQIAKCDITDAFVSVSFVFSVLISKFFSKSTLDTIHYVDYSSYCTVYEAQHDSSRKPLREPSPRTSPRLPHPGRPGPASPGTLRL